MQVVVREVSHKGASSIVEWVDSAGNVKRNTLPSTELIYKNGEVFVEDPDEGAPYGIAWEDLIHTRFGPKAIADLLRQRGIWTLEDYANNTATVTSVFNEACSLNQQQFKEAVLVRLQGKKDEE